MAAEPMMSEGLINTMNWYIIHTYSGFEKKVAETLKSRVEAEGFANQFGQIMVPTENVIELRQGKKVVTPKLFYPGYVLVEMNLNDATWHLVHSTPRVTGFVGSGQMPSPLLRKQSRRGTTSLRPRSTTRLPTSARWHAPSSAARVMKSPPSGTSHPPRAWVLAPSTG